MTSYKGRPLPTPGDRVSVHFDLRPGKKLVSVTDWHPGSEHYGLVVLKTKGPVTLRSVEFVVQPRGPDRVRETGRRFVHAYARGIFYSYPDDECFSKWSRSHLGPEKAAPIWYDPYQMRTFRRYDTGQSVKYAGLFTAYANDEGQARAYGEDLAYYSYYELEEIYSESELRRQACC